MPTNITELVYRAIDEVNEQASNGVSIQKTPDAPLLGGDHGVDSLMFVNLVVAIEDQIQRNLSKSVVLVDEDTMTLQEHPFRTVGTLVHYVETVIGRNTE